MHFVATLLKGQQAPFSGPLEVPFDVCLGQQLPTEDTHIVFVMRPSKLQIAQHVWSPLVSLLATTNCTP